MRYVKMLGLLTVALAALMAFAGSASAITITEAPNDHIDVGDVIEATSEHVELTTQPTVTCEHSLLELTITDPGGTHGGTTTTAKGNVTKLTFDKCPPTVTVVSKGTFELHRIAKNTASLTSTGLELTKLTHHIFLGTTHCISSTNNTNMGSVTGNTLSIESAPIPEVATDSLCGSNFGWHGTYIVTKPASLVIH